MNFRNIFNRSPAPGFRAGRPEGWMEILRVLRREEDTGGAFFSFEKKLHMLDLLRCGKDCYLRETRHSCCAGANTRPESSLTETDYRVQDSDIPALTPDNRQERAGEPEYIFSAMGNDALF